MADDTRQSREPSSAAPEDAVSPEYRAPRRPKPKHDFPKTQAQKMWDAFGNPSEAINEMPGGTFNSAGGKPREVSWRDAFKFSEFNKEGRPAFYQTGCARDSLLVGIGAGGGIGGLRFILKGFPSRSSVIATTNYAVMSFTVAAGAMYYWCTERQREEARGMAAAVAGMKLLNEKKARERAAAREAEIAAEKAEEEKKKNQGWYKFW